MVGILKKCLNLRLIFIMNLFLLSNKTVQIICTVFVWWRRGVMCIHYFYMALTISSTIIKIAAWHIIEAQYSLYLLSQYSIEITPQEPMSRYEAVEFLHIPLGIAVSILCYGFTDKAKLSLKHHCLRRLSFKIEPLSESRPA